MSTPHRRASGAPLTRQAQPIRSGRRPTQRARRTTLRRHLLQRVSHLRYLDSTWICSTDAVRTATAELAGIRPSAVRIRHVQWAYPMFEPFADKYAQQGWDLADWADDAVIAYTGGQPNIVGVNVGRHAGITANTIGRHDYWWFDGGEYWYVTPATITARVELIKQFVHDNATFTDDTMHDLYGLPPEQMEHLQQWADEHIHLDTGGWSEPRRSINERLSEPSPVTQFP